MSYSPTLNDFIYELISQAPIIILSQEGVELLLHVLPSDFYNKILLLFKTLMKNRKPKTAATYHL
jgi:hypothetical protein